MWQSPGIVWAALLMFACAELAACARDLDTPPPDQQPSTVTFQLQNGGASAYVHVSCVADVHAATWTTRYFDDVRSNSGGWTWVGRDRRCFPRRIRRCASRRSARRLGGESANSDPDDDSTTANGSIVSATV